MNAHLSIPQPGQQQQQHPAGPPGQPAMPTSSAAARYPQPPAAPGGGGSQNGAGGADYSAQWAEYYRSIGKVREAEAIEQQMKQKVRIQHISVIVRDIVSGLFTELLLRLRSDFSTRPAKK